MIYSSKSKVEISRNLEPPHFFHKNPLNANSSSIWKKHEYCLPTKTATAFFLVFSSLKNQPQQPPIHPPTSTLSTPTLEPSPTAANFLSSLINPWLTDPLSTSAIIYNRQQQPRPTLIRSCQHLHCVIVPQLLVPPWTTAEVLTDIHSTSFILIFNSSTPPFIAAKTTSYCNTSSAESHIHSSKVSYPEHQQSFQPW